MIIGYSCMEQFDNRELNAVGSSRIRGRWLWENWKAEYPEDECERYVIGKKYDAMIFQKVYWKPMLKAYEGIKIIDLCDPDWLEGRDVMEYVSMCDYCTTSTEPLAEYIRKFVKTPVKCIPDRVELKEHTPRGEHIGRAKKIAWFGYSHNTHYLHQTLEALKEYALELHVISNQAFQSPVGIGFNNIVNHNYSYPNVHDLIKTCDLYLSPERMDAKGIYKSSNKELTAMALGVPVVRTQDDLERLLDADERNKQVTSDLQEVGEKWDIKYSVRELKGILSEIESKKV
jgi:hypothetical protein